MIFAALLTNSWAGDVAICASVLGMFGVTLGLLVNQKKLQKEARESRREEIKSVLSEVITAQPEKMVVSPQPFIVEMRKEFLERADYDREMTELTRRVGNLETWRERDNGEIGKLSVIVAAIPAQVQAGVIALLRDAWHMKPTGGSK